MFFAGLAFFSGEGVSMDQARATQLFLKACSGQFRRCFECGWRQFRQWAECCPFEIPVARGRTLLERPPDGGRRSMGELQRASR